jgi:GT2 family glycosyltransferase
MEEGRPRISVVVPTRGRPELLAKCVAALEAQTVAVEIVVVEDVEGRGPAWARNEGVRRARGEIVCFTDDDCRPFPNWARALSTPILEGKVQATAGPIHMAVGATPGDLAWESIVTYLQEQASKPGTSSPGFAAAANLACCRDLLESVPFDESFPAAAGEDRDWAERAARVGAAPLFVSQAPVLHQPGMSASDFLRKQFWYGRGAARYRGAGPGRTFGSLSFYSRLLRQGFATGARSGLFICGAQIATLAGLITAR